MEITVKAVDGNVKKNQERKLKKLVKRTRRTI